MSPNKVSGKVGSESINMSVTAIAIFQIFTQFY